MVSFDVITMGRISVDVYPQQIGVSLREVDVVRQVPRRLARPTSRSPPRATGRDVATITRTGADPFGEFLHDALQGFGVDDRWVTPVDGLPTPVTFCEIFPPDDFPLYFYREPKAPDLEIHAGRAGPRRDPRRARVLGDGHRALAGAVALAPRSRRWRPSEGITVLDLDYRPMFWASREEARRWVREALRHADVAVGNEDEWETAGDDATVELGDPQARARAACSRSAATSRVEVPPVPVEVVNGLGAGDAFGGALCHGLLADWALERMMRFCNAAGAIVAVAARVRRRDAHGGSRGARSMLESRDCGSSS